MTDQELKDLVASLAVAQAKTDRQIAEVGKQIAETDRKLDKVGKQIGELGNKFGAFTEGMAFPSMSKVLKDRFGMTDVAPGLNFHRSGEAIKIDVLGYDSTGERKEAYVVEVKSRLRSHDLNQLRATIAKLPRFFSPVRDCQIYGIIAAVDVPDELAAKVLKAGFYLAHINDEIFKLQVPRNFQPKAFGPAAKSNGHQNDHANGKSKKKK